MLNKIVGDKADECIWLVDDGCENTGEVLIRSIFNKQLSAAMCESCFRSHLVVIALHKHNQNVEEVLNITSKERETLLKELCAKDDKDMEELLKETELSE
jgi:hypothetical protein